MNEDFIPYELAVKLKEKGFNPQKQPNYLYYNGELVEVKDHYNISPYEIAPTIEEVMKWLREEKKIHFEFVAAAYGYNVIISQTPEAGGTDYYYTHMNDDGPNDGGAWDRYEDAALYCIEYVIDNLI